MSNPISYGPTKLYLSKWILSNLNKAELISLCVYFDIEWRTTIVDIQNKSVYKSNYIVSHSYLVNKLNSFFNLNEDAEQDCVILKYKKCNQLCKYSPVLYGEFTKKSVTCQKLCKSMGIKLNIEVYEYMYNVWARGDLITYDQLRTSVSSYTETVYRTLPFVSTECSEKIILKIDNLSYKRAVFIYTEFVCSLP